MREAVLFMRVDGFRRMVPVILRVPPRDVVKWFGCYTDGI